MKRGSRAQVTLYLDQGTAEKVKVGLVLMVLVWHRGGRLEVSRVES